MDPTPLVIRTAEVSDSAELARVAWQSFHEAFADHPENHPDDMRIYMERAFSEANISHELCDPANTYLVAERDGDIIGYAKLRTGFKEDCVSGDRPVELSRLYCLEAHIGTGIGRALLEECVSRSRQMGCDVMWLGVWEFNFRARAFYDKAGFKRCGDHVFLLGTDRQTDWVMQLALNEA